MMLTPYILTPAEPIKMRYLSLRDDSFAPDPTAHILTLDLLPLEGAMHVLLGHPDWDARSLSINVETICSHLLALMGLCGLIKERERVRWYELSFVAFPEIRLQTIHFKDDGQVLSAPVWGEIPLKNSPFNVSNLMTLNGIKKKG